MEEANLPLTGVVVIFVTCVHSTMYVHRSEVLECGGEVFDVVDECRPDQNLLALASKLAGTLDNVAQLGATSLGEGERQSLGVRKTYLSGEECGIGNEL